MMFQPDYGPDSPNRRISRASRNHASDADTDPYQYAPLITQKVTKPEVEEAITLSSIYIAFLSRRHLHGNILCLSLSILVAGLIGFAASGMMIAAPLFVLSCPGLSWYFLMRPKIRAFAQARAQAFLYTEGSSSRGQKLVDLPSVYVAGTGYKDELGREVLGLYANQFIPRRQDCTARFPSCLSGVHPRIY
jgi:hypothetical protein